jgi:hypothetical protein
MEQERDIRAADFASLSVGDKFFISRIDAVNGAGIHSKLPTTKTSTGAWVNARNQFGCTVFVKYDSKVWIQR